MCSTEKSEDLIMDKFPESKETISVKREFCFLAASFLFVVMTVPFAVAQEVDRSTLPIPLSPFEGEIGKTYMDSEAAWQHPAAPPKGAPNVIVILLDDVGFGQPSTFGGLIPTPILDMFDKFKPAQNVTIPALHD
jgi:hypothetical protein